MDNHKDKIIILFLVTMFFIFFINTTMKKYNIAKENIALSLEEAIE
jgi:hypothetical protein